MDSVMKGLMGAMSHPIMFGLQPPLQRAKRLKRKTKLYNIISLQSFVVFHVTN